MKCFVKEVILFNSKTTKQDQLFETENFKEKRESATSLKNFAKKQHNGKHLSLKQIKIQKKP